VVIKLSQIILCVQHLIDFPLLALRQTPKNQSHVATASIKKPIHNVKEARAASHITGRIRQTAIFIN